MREIKFRVWQKETKFMYNWQPNYGEGLQGIILNELVLAVAVNCGDHQELERQYYPIDSFVLMQFTGLKDSRGKEIYEGDVVKVNLKVDVHGPVLETRFIEVKIEDGICNASKEYIEMSEGHGAAEDVWCDVLSIEVLGNKYENPEILNQKP